MVFASCSTKDRIHVTFTLSPHLAQQAQTEIGMEVPREHKASQSWRKLFGWFVRLAFSLFPSPPRYICRIPPPNPYVHSLRKWVWLVGVAPWLRARSTRGQTFNQPAVTPT